MTVADLLRTLAPMPGYTAPDRAVSGLDVACTGVTHDSRLAARGMVFVALRGLKSDGTAFAPEAMAAGAAAIVASVPAPSSVDAPWFVVDDARLALALLAAEFYEHPSRQMQVVGITGTNGKTTTSYLVSAMFDAAGIKTGLMGTVTYRIGLRALAARSTICA